MTNRDFTFTLNVTVDPEHIDAILKAAVDTEDYDNPNTLKNALTTLFNTAGTDAFQYLIEWGANPVEGRDLSLNDLLVARLAHHNLTPADFENWWLEEDGETVAEPSRYVAVEHGAEGKGKHWLFTGNTLDELAESMDQSEVQRNWVVFVTDLFTGRDLEIDTKLTYI
jgi:hypothetical protein